MKELRCLCGYLIYGATEDEVMRNTAAHARETHSIPEIPAAMVERARARIRDVEKPRIESPGIAPGAMDRRGNGYNLFHPEVLADPYPVYHRLRSEDPVHWDDSLGVWVLTRYADVVSTLHDARLSSDRAPSPDRLKELGLEDLAPVFRTVSNALIASDPPKHTRLRGLMNRAFTPRAVAALRPHIQEIVDRLLDTVQDAGQMDIIRDLAYPLPVTVIAELLGVPPQDQSQFKKWSDEAVAFLGSLQVTADQNQRALQTLFEMTDYFRGVVTQLRENPRDDLLTALVMVEEGGDRLSLEELYANAMFLLGAGHQTTTNLIGNGLLALLRNPEVLRQLQADSNLLEGAIDELLRYDAPVQFVGRVAGEDLEIGGRRIGRGQPVILMLGAANRDPAQFVEPDRLDIRRRENRHVAFGQGVHFCLGAPLARLEGQIAIGTLLRRMPSLRLETEALEWRETLNIHGLKSLPIAFSSGIVDELPAGGPTPLGGRLR